MTFPFGSLAAADRELGLVVSLAIGFAFGFVLERAGFGRATKLSAQFYGYDMTVFKVMFTAIVTAMLGVVIAAQLGLVDLRALSTAAASETFIWPMALGGFLLGAGFIVSGYCPGTSIVATASGSIDGLVTFSGVVIGSVVYAEIYPLVFSFHTSGAKGHLFLYELLGLPAGLVAVAVALMALALFVGAEKLERALRPKFSAASVVDAQPPRRRASFTFIGASAAAAALLLLWPAQRTALAQPSDGISVEQFATRALEEPWRLWILDVRGEPCKKQTVVGAECVSIQQLNKLALADASGRRDLVLVGAEELRELPGAVTAYPGRVLVLKGGFRAYAKFALDRPVPPPPGAPEHEIARYRLRSGMHQAFTGAAAPPPRTPTTASVGVKQKKRGGGCQ